MKLGTRQGKTYTAAWWSAFKKLIWHTEAQYVANYTKEANLKPAWVTLGDRTILI